ncbi:amidohydrolase [Thiotrichales bacterium 19S3-7]|nr:amidohydrolase [Thiotrichales bacterium 19S3-7]MCF6801869.1 amidohydrolase [Thiotrichales bacterium 19S3-11]
MHKQKCSDHNCVLGNIFSANYDKSFLEKYSHSLQDKKVSGDVTIFIAKKIITMNKMMPEANAIAIQGDRIYAVGNLLDIETSLKIKKQPYSINANYKDSFFYPGFIESHCHASMEALYTNFHYIGAFSRMSANAGLLPGLSSNIEIISHLKNLLKQNNPKALVAWGYDPTVLNDKNTITVHDLDEISKEIPIVIMNMSGHIAYVNHNVLEKLSYDEHTKIEGLVKDSNGNLTGELQELEALAPLISKMTLSEEKLVDGFHKFATVANKKGVTTITDLGLGLIPNAWKAMQQVSNEDSFPVKISNYVINHVYEHLGGSKAFFDAKTYENKKLKLSGIKVIADGSMQGYTANMNWPYYYDSDTNGMSNIKVPELNRLLQDLLRHDIQVAIHTNGDASIDEVLSTIEHVLRFAPDRDPRFRLEHCQTVTEPQLKKMRKYNVMANFFINHIYYWGDFHAKHTLGPERVKHMNPLNSAKQNDIIFALHSDSPITGIDPLLMIQNAVLRQSLTKQTLGENECITAYDALKAITKDAAYLLREEDEKGTLEVGKLADITILEEDIFAVAADKIADIKIIGTLVNGEIFC